MIRIILSLVCVLSSAQAQVAQQGAAVSNQNSAQTAQQSQKNASQSGIQNQSRPAVENEEDSESSKRTVTDLIRMRDPFKMPDLSKFMGAGKKKSALEFIPIEDLKLVGVMTGPSKIQAMLKAPDGKVYYIGKNDRVGVQNGRVVEISNTQVKVREIVPNILGQPEKIMSTISLAGGGSVQKFTTDDVNKRSEQVNEFLNAEEKRNAPPEPSISDQIKNAIAEQFKSAVQPKEEKKKESPTKNLPGSFLFKENRKKK